MILTRGRRRVTRAVAAAATVCLASALLVGTALVGASPAAAAGLCATPGSAGAGGTLTGVVNAYYPGLGAPNAGANSISVGTPSGAPTAIAAGDLLLVIQMQGADIDSSNTDSYGDGGAAPPASGDTALNSTGRYEYVRATSAVNAGSVAVSGLGPGGGLLNSYVTAAATPTSGQRTFQVVRVPQYMTATTSSTLTATAWNGSVGGVLALDTTAALTLAGTANVNGQGFRGGANLQRSGGVGTNADVRARSAIGAHGNKAEGIAGTPTGTTTADGYPNGDVARGAPGNAGGGGTDGNPPANDQNSGGGGGGNGGAGGVGGDSWSSVRPVGGYGGGALPATAGRVFLGGGGGEGTNNNEGGPDASSGAAGGGIVLIRAGSVAGSGSISANGAAAFNDTLNDGGGGGGAGGAIVLSAATGPLTAATLHADGGRGGDAWHNQPGATSAHGPGGGGGGGWIFTSSAPTLATVAFGASGVTTNIPGTTFGASPGTNGQTASVTPSAIPGVSAGAECADLSLTKTGPASVGAGASLTYQLSVANAGPADATAVTVTDTLPAGTSFLSAAGTGWSCDSGNGGAVTCTRPAIATGSTAPPIAVSVTAPAGAGTAVNQAIVTAATADPDPANNVSSVRTTVDAMANVSIRKTGPGSVPAGGGLAYNLAVTNAGPSDAGTLTVTDTLPEGVRFVSATGAGWSCDHAGNASVTCTRAGQPAGSSAPLITLSVTAPRHATDLMNSAAVTSSVHDGDLSDNTSRATTTVGPAADVFLVKRGPGKAGTGKQISYVVHVGNRGPDAATLVEVVDTLPGDTSFVSATGRGWRCGHDGNRTVTCRRKTLAAGASAPDIVVVLSTPATPTSLINTAAVSTTSFDPRRSNNSATVRTAVLTNTNTTSGGLVRTGAYGLLLAPLGLGVLVLGALLLALARKPD